MPKTLKFFLALVAFFALAPVQATAQDRATAPAFSFPLACSLGETCWVLNYPDTGPDKDGVATDSACLSRTYEDHKGTDFAIPDEAAMKKGVTVLAARDGTVMRIRDSEPDRWPSAEDLEKTKQAKRECGNAVLIDHGDGWQTMYCHLKRGSVTVKPKQNVRTGDVIGQVGLSGLTEFPHLHFGLIHKGKVIDPFTGADLSLPCGQSGESLWSADTKLAYEPVAFFDLGFDRTAPVLKNLDRTRNDRTALRRDVGALVFHATMLGLREGDKVDLSVTSPDGKIFAQKTILQEKNRARQMYYVGRKIPEAQPLALGPYKGTVTITRGEARYTREEILSVQ